jgi:hypothetical protein
MEDCVRRITYDGATYELSERNWKQMLRRFDARRASLNLFGYYFIRGKSICVAREYKCIRCPLRSPYKKVNSCTFLFEKMIGEDLLPYIHLRDSGVAWHPNDDEKGRAGLQKVMDVLSNAEHFEKYEGGQ